MNLRSSYTKLLDSLLHVCSVQLLLFYLIYAWFIFLSNPLCFSFDFQKERSKLLLTSETSHCFTFRLNFYHLYQIKKFQDQRHTIVQYDFG